jgi:hypothetical protein
MDEKRESGSTTTFGATLPSGSLVGVAWDGDANKNMVRQSKFVASEWQPFCGKQAQQNSGTISTASYFAVKSYNSSVVNLNTGGKGFTYTPPTGFVALATQNLPAPTIADPSAYFNTVLYTGTGATQAITGVGFQPDFVWIKSRTSAYFHRLQDSVRGATKEIYSNATSAEVTDATTLSSFDSNGFTVETQAGYNASLEPYVAWCWKANGAASSNTDGSITSSVSANTTSGFSIATYAGNSTAGATIGHGLASVPKFAIFKRRDTTGNWLTYHHSIGNTDALFLNLTNAKAASVQYFNNTSPTSSLMTFGINGDVNQTGFNYVGYLWAEVEGFSKFGSYTGNGSAAGPFVYTGFRPAFVIIKRTDGASDNWIISDSVRNPFNPTSAWLFGNLSDAESNPVGTPVNFFSNGFSPSGTATSVNASGGTYIYAAFAEHPFQGDDGYTQARAR